jgi:hypothetical protein
MNATAETIVLGPAAWARLTPGANMRARNSVAYAGCADAIARNAAVTLIIVRNPAGHGLVEVHG